MTCRYIIDFLDDYLDGRLPWWKRQVFEMHLRACADCRAYLASYAETVRLEKSVRLENEVDRRSDDITPLPEELVQAVLAVLKSDTAQRS